MARFKNKLTTNQPATSGQLRHLITDDPRERARILRENLNERKVVLTRLQAELRDGDKFVADWAIRRSQVAAQIDETARRIESMELEHRNAEVGVLNARDEEHLARMEAKVLAELKRVQRLRRGIREQQPVKARTHEPLSGI